jgi:uncharacterized membrane protein
MNLPKLEELNSEKFLNDAFDEHFHNQLEKGTLLRRNVYMWLFIAGFICILITALTDQMILSILSLFLATVSLVVMSKYDTQLFFLKNLKLREEKNSQEA